MMAGRTGVLFFVSILFLTPTLLVAREPAPAWFAPATVVDLLRPDKPAAGPLQTLKARGIPVQREGSRFTFRCPPETPIALLVVREDGMIASSMARFELSDPESFADLLRAMFRREGKERCEKDRCIYLMKGWTARIEIGMRDAPAGLTLEYARTDVPGPAKNFVPQRDPSEPSSRDGASGAKPAKTDDWLFPHARGPYATKGYRYRNGSMIWRTGNLPSDAPKGSLAGIWGTEHRYGWDYLTFFLGGDLYKSLPSDGFNLVVPKGKRDAGLRYYTLAGDLLTMRIGTLSTRHRLRLLEQPNGRPLPFSRKAFRRLYRSPKTRLCLSRTFSREDLGTCYQRVDLCPDSWNLHGEWRHRSTSVSGGVAIAPRGMIYRDSSGRTERVVSSTAYVESEDLVWSFRNDGTVSFSRSDRLATAVEPDGRTRGASGDSSTRHGTYRLQGCELQVRWSNGKREYYFVRSPQGYAAPKSLLVDEVSYERT